MPRTRRGLVGSRVVSALWLLFAVLTLHLSAPSGGPLAAAPSGHNIAGNSFSAGKHTSDPVLQQRLPTLGLLAEARDFAGRQDLSAGNDLPVGLQVTAGWWARSASTAFGLDRATAYRPAAVRHFDARGPPRTA